MQLRNREFLSSARPELHDRIVASPFTMMRSLLVFLFLAIFVQTSYSQDTLFLKSSSRYVGKLRRLDSAQVIFSVPGGSSMVKTSASMREIQSIRPGLNTLTYFGYDTIYKFNTDRIIGSVVKVEHDSVYMMDVITGNSQKITVSMADIQSVGFRSDKKIKEKSTSEYETADETNMISLGIGIGMDHGGFGLNLAVYPEKHIGIFLGAGYAVIGPGFNGGIKLRIFSNRSTPYASVMYGYNAVIAVQNASQYNKMFYGVTFGFGMDIRANPEKKSYFSLGLLVPIRGKEVQAYMDDLKKNHGVDFKGGLPAIGISLSYRIILK